MEKNKYTLYTIIFLLIICLPCSIYGTYKHVLTNVNVNQKFKFNNKLYFYEDSKLLGTYDCDSENCNYTTFTNNDSTATIINSRYTFITDDKKTYLYDITAGKKLKRYDEVHYTMGNVYIVREKELWGAININTTINRIFDCNYDALKFKNNKFLALKDKKWTISQGQNELFSSYLEIKDFNNDFIILTDGVNDKIVDFENNEYINTISDKSLSFVSDFILLKRSNNYYVYQFNKIAEGYTPAVIGNFYCSGENEITHSLTESTIEFYDGEELLKSIEFSIQEND